VTPTRARPKHPLLLNVLFNGPIPAKKNASPQKDS
jgi:hypothetical protein